MIQTPKPDYSAKATSRPGSRKSDRGHQNEHQLDDGFTGLSSGKFFFSYEYNYYRFTTYRSFRKFKSLEGCVFVGMV